MPAGNIRKRISGIPVFCITGFKNAGKTTLVTRLVAELTRRGYHVATIKFAHHEVEVDHEGRDSFRHRAAGARSVALISPYRWAVMHELDESAGEAPPAVEDIVPLLGKPDLVLIEGRTVRVPKLEVCAKDTTRPPLAESDAYVVAVAAAGGCRHERLPGFDRDDIAAIADFIEDFLELERS